jgi:hypothetical protein
VITSDDIWPKEWMSWVIANDMVRTFGRREGGECFPAEYQLTRLIYRSEKPLLGFGGIGALSWVKLEDRLPGSGLDRPLFIWGSRH